MEHAAHMYQDIHSKLGAALESYCTTAIPMFVNELVGNGA
jgi:hypothetical protein